MITLDRDYVTSRYNLKKLKEIEDLVADGKHPIGPMFTFHCITSLRHCPR